MVRNAAPSNQPPYVIQVICPSCSSMECDLAVLHGLQDLLRRLIGMVPWQCSRCRARFYLRRRSFG